LNLKKKKSIFSYLKKKQTPLLFKIIIHSGKSETIKDVTKNRFDEVANIDGV